MVSDYNRARTIGALLHGGYSAAIAESIIEDIEAAARDEGRQEAVRLPTEADDE